MTAVASAGTPIADRQSNVIGHYPLTSCFVLAFAGAWAVFLVYNLSAAAWGRVLVLRPLRRHRAPTELPETR